MHGVVSFFNLPIVHVLKYVLGHVLRISVEIKGRTDKTVAGGMGFWHSAFYKGRQWRISHYFELKSGNNGPSSSLVAIKCRGNGTEYK
jgi:hypothetical protein